MNKGDSIPGGKNRGRRRRFWIGLAVLGGLSLGACGGDYGSGRNYTGGGGGAVTVDPLLSDIQAKVFSPTCAAAGCHSAAFKAQGLDLSSGNTFTAAVDVASTENGALKIIESVLGANSSYMIWKLEGPPAWTIAGGRMPLGRTPLGPSAINAIRQWIDLGARDD